MKETGPVLNTYPHTRVGHISIPVLSFLLFTLLQIASFGSAAQNCTLSLYGEVRDRSTGMPLAYSEVLLEGANLLVICDAEGRFQFKQLCGGNLHVQVSHVGCHTVHVYIQLERDTTVRILLSHNAEFLDEMVVHGEREQYHVQHSHTLDEHQIGDASHKGLAELIESIPGISSLKGGSGIAKPVIQGLYGNRISILNNGLLHGGQMWGNDHAPEIDPFTAGHISVVKGAGALEYGGNSLGGIVLIEPNTISQDPNLQGQLNYAFAHNNRGHNINVSLERRNSRLGWRVTSSIKKGGDYKTPDYFLTNTGRSEQAASVLLEPVLGLHWKHQLYYSLVRSDIAILRGAHIGNLSDLQAALEADTPFFTREEFSYERSEPRQEVRHHLFKWESVYSQNAHRFWKIRYGLQLNQRKEYDVRRAGRSESPALSLQLFSHDAALFHQRHFSELWTFKSGFQFQIRDNYNIPGTGVLPLIPNYRAYTPGTFAMFQRHGLHHFLELGARYDYRHMEVWKLLTTPQRNFEKVVKQYQPMALSFGYRIQLSDSQTLLWNASMHRRAPEINELYSFGLHQGVSGIEEGNENLKSETAAKLSLTWDRIYRSSWIFQWSAFAQSIRDYMYLAPAGKYRLTIRGAFPVFQYRQTHAALVGTDFQVSHSCKHIKHVWSASAIRGYDLSADLPLIYIPADYAQWSMNYFAGHGKKLENRTAQVGVKAVSRQHRLDIGQDFVTSPNGYVLVEMSLGAYVPLKEGGLDVHVFVENALNSRYRDYLNRLRYFADEYGRNIVFRVNYQFEHGH